MTNEAKKNNNKWDSCSKLPRFVLASFTRPQSKSSSIPRTCNALCMAIDGRGQAEKAERGLGGRRNERALGATRGFLKRDNLHTGRSEQKYIKNDLLG